MKNPLRDEGSAFQAVLVTLGGAVLIVVAAWISDLARRGRLRRPLAAALWAIRGGMRQPAVAGARRARRGRADAPHPRRRERDRRRARSCSSSSAARPTAMREEVLLVCPALNSRVRTWTSDEDGARAAAQARLDASLAQLAEAGVTRAARSATATRCRRSRTRSGTFPADEIVLSTHPPGRSHWLEQGVVELRAPALRRARHPRRRRPRRGPRPAAVRATCRRSSATYFATASICASLSWPLKDGIPPWPFVTRSIASSWLGFASSRFGPTVPLEPASASVWQPPQPAEAKIALPSVSPPSGGAGFGGFAGSIGSPFASRPATAATYVATSSASCAREDVGGHPGRARRRARSRGRRSGRARPAGPCSSPSPSMRDWANA